jgi:predicted nucleic acid-binding protein
MAWVVDTCLLLDIGLDDPGFGAKSERLLQRVSADGLTICPVTFVELAPAFGGELGALRHFLSALDVACDEAWAEKDTERSARAWAQHILGRRSASARGPKRPVADVLIGAFASRFDGLLTRNTADFAKLYPKLRILSPA